MPVSATQYSEVVKLRDERKGLANKALELVEKTRLEKREFNAEEKETYDKLVNQVDTLGKEVETRENLWKALATDENEVAKLPPHLRQQYQNTGGVTELEKRQVECLVQYFKGDRRAPDRPEYRDVQLTTPSAGGFLMLPEKLSERLIKKVDDLLWISKYCTNIGLTDTKTLGIPTIESEMDDLSWTTEIAAIPENTGPTFGKRALVMNPFRTMIKVSDMWLNTITSKDFFSADAQNGVTVTPTTLIENRLAYHIARTKENNWFNGNGVNKPLGLFVDSTRGISGGVDQGAGLSYNGLVNTKYSLKVQYYTRSTWVFQRSIMAALMKLADTNNRPLLNFSTFPTQPDTLLGSPLMLSEFCPSTIVNGSYIGLYGDLSFYWTIYNPRTQVKIVDQLFAQTAQTAFFALQEADGMPVLNEAFARLRISA